MVIHFITVPKGVTLSLGKCYKGRRLRLKDLNFDWTILTAKCSIPSSYLKKSIDKDLLLPEKLDFANFTVFESWSSKPKDLSWNYQQAEKLHWLHILPVADMKEF